MDKTEQLEAEVQRLFAGFRLVLTALLAWCIVRPVGLHIQGDRCKYLWTELLEGIPMSPFTWFFLTFRTPVFGAVGVAASAAVVFLLVRPKHPSAIRFGTVVAIAAVTVLELGAIALQIPWSSIFCACG